MKKILSGLMCFMVLFGVCVVGTGCDPNEETEAEYKARIKKELDEIPVEATGYKLVDPTKQEVTYPEGESPKFGLSQVFGEHEYYWGIETFEGGIKRIFVSRDKPYENKKYIRIYDDEIIKEYTDNFYVCCYDGKLFIILTKQERSTMYAFYYDDNLPPVLFYYDIEENYAKYIGYQQSWFDYSIYDAADLDFFTTCKIVKL